MEIKKANVKTGSKIEIQEDGYVEIDEVNNIWENIAKFMKSFS